MGDFFNERSEVKNPAPLLERPKILKVFAELFPKKRPAGGTRPSHPRRPTNQNLKCGLNSYVAIYTLDEDRWSLINGNKCKNLKRIVKSHQKGWIWGLCGGISAEKE